MKKHLCLSLVVFALALPAAFARSGGHCSSSHSSSHHSSSSPRSGKTQHVRGYRKKDGTYVSGFDRHPSSAAPAGSSMSTSIYGPPVAYRKGYIAEGFTPHASVQRDSRGRIKRSSAAKDAFKHQRPCPSTGRTSGSCPGYVIDHVNPLECGGADAPENMQWQTKANAKAKDKIERYCR